MNLLMLNNENLMESGGKQFFPTKIDSLRRYVVADKPARFSQAWLLPFPLQCVVKLGKGGMDAAPYLQDKTSPFRRFYKSI
jgi:hypothetical protein